MKPLRMAGSILGVGALGAGGALAADALAYDDMDRLAQGMTDPAKRHQTVPSGPNWFDQNKAIPGNSWISPDQGTQHDTGNPAELDWQYPFFRQDLVDAGLLPANAPPGTPAEIDLPAGLSVLEAIERGVIR